MIKIAIFGYGTVGYGVADVLETNRETIKNKSKVDLEVKYILDIKEFPGDKNESKIVKDIDVILNDPEIKICCETMGGLKVAYEFSKMALEKGKSVCTSNKELVEAYGTELVQIAKDHNCNYFFEASVGGGIPIIRNITSCLCGDRIEKITGILNGTTNYMLTKMAMEAADYHDVLKEAQEKGYAELNPEADVEGYDAARKIAILASLMSGKTVSYNDLYVEGISQISSADFAYAKAMGTSIKLLGTCQQEEEKVFAMLAPGMVAATNPLYMVNDVFNGIVVKGNMLGDAMFYGAGAGKLPTASAVVADIVEAAKHVGIVVSRAWSKEKAELISIEESRTQFFVRTSKESKDLAVTLFGDLEAIELAEYPDEFAFVTEEMSEKDFAQAYAKLEGAKTRIRMTA